MTCFFFIWSSDLNQDSCLQCNKSLIYLLVCVHGTIILHCIILSDCPEISCLYLIKMHTENYDISSPCKISY